MRRSAMPTRSALLLQIRDDMLDVIGDEATFGKPIGSDKAEEKDHLRRSPRPCGVRA